MAIIGISKYETEDYISRFDIAPNEEEGATIFVLGALDVVQRAFVADRTGSAQELTDDGSVRFVQRVGTRNLLVTRLALRGWRNFKDQSGGDIPFATAKMNVMGREYEVVSDDTLQRLGMDLINELGEAIIAKNSFLETALKNLNGLARQSDSFPAMTAPVASPDKEQDVVV